MKKEINIYHELEETTRIFKNNIPKELLKPPIINSLLKDVLIDYIIIILSMILYTFSFFAIKILLLVIIVSRLHSLGVILHDLTHMPIKKKNYKIIILEILAGYPIGTSINAMRYHHLRHHKESGMETDPYFHHFKNYNKNNILLKIFNIMIGFILIPSWILRSIFGVVCLLHPKLQILYAKKFLEHKGEIRIQDLNEIRQCCQEDIKQIIYLSVLFFMCIKLAGFNLFFQLYIIPILFTGVISYYRTLKEHNYKRVYDRKLITLINITNNHNTDNFLKFLLAPRNIGYHIEHHLHPQVGYKYLKKIRNHYLKYNKDIYKC